MRILTETIMWTVLSLCFLCAAPAWGQELLPEEIEELNEDCLDCHEDLDEDEAEHVFPNGRVIRFQVDAEEHGESAHGTILACVSCHEAYDDDHPDFEYESEREYAQSRSDLCVSCHEDTRPLHPDENGDTPLCSDCHSAHRDLPFEAAPFSVVARCGSCHEPELADFREGGHAQAISPTEPNSDMPRCITCHPAHEVSDGPELRLATRVTTLCVDCHSDSRIVLEYEQTGTAVSSYMDDFHGLTFQHLVSDQEEPEQDEVMTCATCHGPHKVGRPEDEQIAEICASCHEGTSERFAGAWLGHGEIGPKNGMIVWAVRVGYRVLIPLMLVGLLLNIVIQLIHHFRDRRALAFEREATEKAREEAGDESRAFVTRFSHIQRAEHTLCALLFVMLVLTGLPQSYPGSTVAENMIRFWGGIGSTRLIHRTCGFLFVGLMVLHVARGVIGTIRSHRQPEILPTTRDFRQIYESLKHNLGLGPAPRYGKFDYGEKFEYMGLFLGGILIGLTGVLLVFPEFVARYLPGILLTAARVAHSYEATLAVLVVVVWHIWSVVLRPEIFPLDTTIFTGKMDVDRLKEEHAAWYDELVEDGALETDHEGRFGPAQPLATVAGSLTPRT